MFVLCVPCNKLLDSLRIQFGSGMPGTNEIHLDLSCKASIKLYLCCVIFSEVELSRFNMAH